MGYFFAERILTQNHNLNEPRVHWWRIDTKSHWNFYLGDSDVIPHHVFLVWLSSLRRALSAKVLQEPRQNTAVSLSFLFIFWTCLHLSKKKIVTFELWKTRGVFVCFNPKDSIPNCHVNSNTCKKFSYSLSKWYVHIVYFYHKNTWLTSNTSDSPGYTCLLLKFFSTHQVLLLLPIYSWM